ncbi:hypothetical protein ACFLXQ_03285 [Chloroflexota bacterium]
MVILEGVLRFGREQFYGLSPTWPLPDPGLTLAHPLPDPLLSLL